MTKRELNFFRKVLMHKKEEFLNNSHLNLKKIIDVDHVPKDEGDYAAKEVRQYIDCSMHSKDRKKLLEIEKALLRVEKGDFGICESCGDKISLGRLKARPFSSLCIDCKEDLENESRKLA
jgi:DnaK suppressor protein